MPDHWGVSDDFSRAAHENDAKPVKTRPRTIVLGAAFRDMYSRTKLILWSASHRETRPLHDGFRPLLCHEMRVYP